MTRSAGAAASAGSSPRAPGSTLRPPMRDGEGPVGPSPLAHYRSRSQLRLHLGDDDTGVHSRVALQHLDGDVLGRRDVAELVEVERAHDAVLHVRLEQLVAD